MHKKDLISVVASKTGLSKKDVNSMLDATLEAMEKALKKGEKVTLIGFGTFSVVKSPARKGRNPQTGKEIRIPASKRVKFSVGKALKASVNK
ncbi:HU family DNA-binding protein [Pseudomonadota bacterium]